MEEIAGRTARALAILHRAELLYRQGVITEAHPRFIEAATEFEGLIRDLDLAPMKRFLARAYAGAYRFEEALSLLDDHCRTDASNTEAAEERTTIARQARARIVQGAVQHILIGTPPSAQMILTWNRDLLDDEFKRNVHATVLHYADRSDLTIFEAMRALLAILSEITGSEFWRAVELEGLGVMQVAYRRPVAAIAQLEVARDAYLEMEALDLVATASNHLGLARSDAGLFELAEEDFIRAIEHHRARGDPVEAARVMENLAASLGRRSNFERSLEVARQALSTLEAEGKSDLANKVSIVIAEALKGLGRSGDALAVIDVVVEKGRDLWADQPELHASALANKGYILERLGRIADAHRCLIEARGLVRLSRTAQITSSSLEFGGVHAELNDYEEAIREELRALAKNQEDELEFDAARNKLNLAKLLMTRLTALPYSEVSSTDGHEAIEELVNAGELLDEAIRAFSTTTQRVLLIEAKRQRAVLRWLLGETELAAEELTSVIQEAVLAGEEAPTASLLQNLAMVYLSSGRLDDAKTAVTRALPHASARADHGLLWYLDWLRARMEHLDGNVEEAAQTYRRLIRAYEASEDAVGTTEFIIAWSRNKSFAFDDALHFFIQIRDFSSAYEVALLSKARTYQAELSQQSEHPPALSAADVAALL